MARKRTPIINVSIALRIALLAWLVALATISIFVLVTVPQQKRTFLENLESKANGLAVSLHDVAAGAAVNEDYASVVSAAQTLLAGDPDLEFLIISKNDGFSLIIEQESWHVEQKISPYWFSRKRISSRQIDHVPYFDRRVFHFAQPFDYSGIQWGWIHVGLSLKGYDHSVSKLYENTIVLALACTAFSLIISVLYSRQLVRPIVRLRHMVEQIASGDLSVRITMPAEDELGSLAHSVNTMASALLRRDRILESVRFAAQQFLQIPRWEEAIFQVLEHLAQATGVSRSCVYKSFADRKQQPGLFLLYEWTSKDTVSLVTDPRQQSIIYANRGLEQWPMILKHNGIITRKWSKMTSEEQLLFESPRISSLLCIPIFAANELWGALFFDDASHERDWSDAEKDSLRTVADMLGTTITRQMAQKEVLESKNTLEQRVTERTEQLSRQVAAKEKALADLASAQNSLVEMSRAAGMAEVATGVLHNVGNVLNSVNVSCTILTDQLRDSRMVNVAKVAELLKLPKEELVPFLTTDPRGQHIPEYIETLGASLREEHKTMFREASSLSDRVEHIKEIVTMQQSYGNVSGISETISPERLLEDAITLHAGSLVRHNITVTRYYHPVPAILTDKHKVLQILLNLITNATHACIQGKNTKKTITLRIYNAPEDSVCFEVSDNGMGIAQENLTRIFQHGFTTRRSGHGFGLHSGALAAHELGGTLQVKSEGLEKGATFALQLPCRQGESQ